MKARDTRLWALIIAAAFLILWCVSVSITCAIPAQEPLAQPIKSVTAPEIEAIGICGWAIVGAGTLGVVATVILSCRTPRRRRRTHHSGVSRASHRSQRSVYMPHATHRYQRNIERRF